MCVCVCNLLDDVPSSVVAAFGFSEVAPANLTRVRNKEHLKVLLKDKIVTSFQEHLAPASHACDLAASWTGAAAAIGTQYAFGCEVCVRTLTT